MFVEIAQNCKSTACLRLPSVHPEVSNLSRSWTKEPTGQKHGVYFLSEFNPLSKPSNYVMPASEGKFHGLELQFSYVDVWCWKRDEFPHLHRGERWIQWTLV